MTVRQIHSRRPSGWVLLPGKIRPIFYGDEDSPCRGRECRPARPRSEPWCHRCMRPVPPEAGMCGNFIESPEGGDVRCERRKHRSGMHRSPWLRWSTAKGSWWEDEYPYQYEAVEGVSVLCAEGRKDRLGHYSRYGHDNKCPECRTIHQSEQR